MKTDDLIAALAADTRPGPGVAGRLMLTLPVALVATVVAFLVIWGVRPNLGAALSSAAVMKSLLPLVVAVLAGALALTQSRPEVRPGWQAVCLWGLGAALLVAISVAAARGGWQVVALAQNNPTLLVCLASIPALAMPLLGAALWALSAGAPRRPALSGGVAGLAAGGLAAVIYSFYCDQDAALFFLPAYAAGIMIVALIGMLIGSRTLAW